MEIIKYRVQLPTLMRKLNLPLRAVECGVAEGFNSADLLRNGIEYLYMVDNFGTIPTAKGDGASGQSWHDSNMNKALERVAPFAGKFRLLKGISWEMADKVENNSLGLVYLDAGHSYEDVKKDLEAWFPKLVDGGVMAGHDYLASQYGVKQAVTEFARGRYMVNTIYENKDEDAGFYFIKQ